MPLFDLVPALGLAWAPGLRQLAPLLDAAPLCRAGNADFARRLPRPLLDGRPSPPVAVPRRRLVVKPVEGGSDEAPECWRSDSLVLRQCGRL
jgi:hypothetical protein